MNRTLFVSFLTLVLVQTPVCSDGIKKKVELGAEKAPTLGVASEKTLGEFRYSIANIADKVLPVIVSIQTESSAHIEQGEDADPFEFFFGPGFQNRGPNRTPNTPKSTPKQQGLGSGVIVSKEGYILTNNHVVENADNITVTLNDKREYKAKIVGTDAQTDVALIKLEKAPNDLSVAFLGKSEELRVGEWIIAIGNPFGLSRTVTTGIVSAKGVHNRGLSSYENFIQTDAAINPGNSGGGMFNLAGELVGINSAILSRNGGFQGIGFAIPIDIAKQVIAELLENGKVSRGWLGVSIQDINPKIAHAMKLDSLQGALVAEVLPDGPASKAGILVGDVITSINGKPLSDANALRYAVSMVKPNEVAEFGLLRDGKKIKLKIKVSSRDDVAEANVDGGSSSTGVKELGIDVAAIDDATRKELKLTKEDGGVLVRSVTDGGLAAEAGLMANDIILDVNKKAVKGLAAFQDLIKAEPKGASLLLLVKRGQGRLYIALEK